jgi:glycosyltransferase involved in cell wall biosynthesis
MHPVVFNRPIFPQPPEPPVEAHTHLNIITTSLGLGGAGRTIHDTVAALAGSHDAATTVDLFVLNGRVSAGELPMGPSLKVHGLGDARSQAQKVQDAAKEILSSPSKVAYTHMMRIHDASSLWAHGIKTIPVIHNVKETWLNSPNAFDPTQVPFVVAVSEHVEEELKADHCPVPVHVLRHEIQRWMTQEQLLRYRQLIRRQHNIRESCFLIGMVGDFKLHKAYTRALRVLHSVRRYFPARLMVIGGWDQKYGGGIIAHTAVCKLALDLGVSLYVIMLGTILPAHPYYAAFDAFLNTSVYEGLSLATLEAIQAGCPVVSADAGGQGEVLGAEDFLIRQSAGVEAYVNALRKIRRRKSVRTVLAEPPLRAELVPKLWVWLANYATAVERKPQRASVLFMTNNLNVGGPERSLVNLLCALPAGYERRLCVLNETSNAAFLEDLDHSATHVFSLCGSRGVLDRVDKILTFIREADVDTLCFWNVDAGVKLLLSKILCHRRVRLVDVSPGPMLFKELSEAELFGKRISFSVQRYLERLDLFVAKYKGGTIPASYGDFNGKTLIIPNGVPFVHCNGGAGPVRVRPDWAEPDFAVVTCCRIAPNKLVHVVLDVASELAALIPGATITIVGGVDHRHRDYWGELQERHKRLKLERIVHFAGCRSDVLSFLGEFRAFLMLSRDQGCPNSSLEAMTVGLPVVANDDGGTSEQVEDKVTGFLVPTDDVRAIAQRLREVLTHPDLAAGMGDAGRQKVLQEFSLELMVERYAGALWRSERAGEVPLQANLGRGGVPLGNNVEDMLGVALASCSGTR